MSESKDDKIDTRSFIILNKLPEIDENVTSENPDANVSQIHVKRPTKKSSIPRLSQSKSRSFSKVDDEKEKNVVSLQEELLKADVAQQPDQTKNSPLNRNQCEMNDLLSASKSETGLNCQSSETTKFDINIPSKWKSEDPLLANESPPPFFPKSKLENPIVKDNKPKIGKIDKGKDKLESKSARGLLSHRSIGGSSGGIALVKKNYSSTSLTRSVKSNDTGTTRLITKSRNTTATRGSVLGKVQSLEAEFTNKRQQYMKRKKELQLAQTTTVDLYKSLKDLQKRIALISKKDLPLESFDYIHFDTNRSQTRPMTEKLESFAMDFESILKSTTKHARDILNKRKQTLDALRGANDDDEDEVIVAYARDLDALEMKINEMEKQKNIREMHDVIVQLCPKNAAEMTELREKYVKVAEDLRKSDAHAQKLQQKIYALENDTSKVKWQSLEDELNEQKNRTTTLDKKLKTLRSKLITTENQRKSLELKVAEFEQEKKQMELQTKQKFCDRLNRVNRSNKELQTKTERLEAENLANSAKVKELEDQLALVQSKLENDRLNYQSRVEQLESENQLLQLERNKNEKDYKSMKNKLVKMEVQNLKVSNLSKNQAILVPAEGRKSTPMEIKLFTELQATQVVLKLVRQKLTKMKEEKARFMVTIKQAIAEKTSLTQEGWAAKLIEKDEEIQSLSETVQELSDGIVIAKDIYTMQETTIHELEESLERYKKTEEMLSDSGAKKLHQRVLDLEHQLVSREKLLKNIETKLLELYGIIKKNGQTAEKSDDVKLAPTKPILAQLEMIHDEINVLLRQFNDLTTQKQAVDEKLSKLTAGLECKSLYIERLERTLVAMNDAMVVKKMTADKGPSN